VTGYELVTYESEHREDYLRLLRDAWGEGAMSGEEFDWWFDGNPAGSLRSVAVMDGRVVGVAAHSLYRMVLGGEEQIGSFSVHATTEAAARGRGIFVELERKHEREAAERGVACVLASARWAGRRSGACACGCGSLLRRRRARPLKRCSSRAMPPPRGRTT
jgi:hypothetical protein